MDSIEPSRLRCLRLLALGVPSPWHLKVTTTGAPDCRSSLSLASVASYLFLPNTPFARCRGRALAATTRWCSANSPGRRRSPLLTARRAPLHGLCLTGFPSSRRIHSCARRAGAGRGTPRECGAGARCGSVLQDALVEIRAGVAHGTPGADASLGNESYCLNTGRRSVRRRTEHSRTTRECD